ncbi:MAG: hypothetical protein FJZ11_01820 [Candidatus Omnitrophica bacterium]|nr:hypothetical protein [Candidatus Omnitrophota bacterium]
MRRCKICKVPLEGPLSKVANVLFKIKPADDNLDICNKCAADKPKKYKCQICDRYIDESAALSHVKAEEYILNLIKKDHPEWQHDKETCQECLEYYRKLIKQAEI